MKTVTIEQALAIATVLCGGNTAKPCEEAKPVPYSVEQHGLALLVADRGHVWVGNVSNDTQWAYVKDARIVRVWGTDKGLNQLAVEGPRPNTKLDMPADVRVAMRAVIAVIPCNAAAWADK